MAPFAMGSANMFVDVLCHVNHPRPHRIKHLLGWCAYILWVGLSFNPAMTRRDDVLIKASPDIR
jgi:hypothetical protein